MNISVTTSDIEFHYGIKKLFRSRKVTEVEILALISSFCIVTTVIPLVKYDNLCLATNDKDILLPPHRTLLTINRTFINLLVRMDCLNSLGHIPILFQYLLWVCTFNYPISYKGWFKIADGFIKCSRKNLGDFKKLLRLSESV